jgi:superfamily II DNA/RNA helicase
VQILIGTPAAVTTAVSESRAVLDVSSVKILILDEADALVKKPPPARKGDSKASFLRDIDRLIARKLPPNTSIGFFSASFSPEAIGEIKKWRPELVEVRKQEVPKHIRHFDYVARNPEAESVPLIVRIASKQFISQGIVFLGRKDQPGRVAKGLAERGMDSRWATGDTHRGERLTMLTDFRGNRFKFLVTTNMYPPLFPVAQVGISRHSRDTLRPNVVDYQHRAGRVGRFGRAGV